MSPRLWIESIRSVGAVSEGDDPQARIEFWKARNTDTDPTTYGDGQGRPPKTSSRTPRRPGTCPTCGSKLTPKKANPMKKNTETIADRCVEVVHKRAHDAMLKQFGTTRGLTEAQLRAAVWQSADGRLLLELARSPFGQKPASEALSEIHKSADGRFDKALAILAG